MSAALRDSRCGCRENIFFAEGVSSLLLSPKHCQYTVLENSRELFFRRHKIVQIESPSIRAVRAILAELFPTVSLFCLTDFQLEQCWFPVNWN